MVKPQGAVSPKRPSFLRIDMKRKLTLPAPFVVSRGYTPEYPWLGQQHPDPEPKKKPKLLMQQSPASIFKCILCVACFILGLALIAYAGSTILRGQFARRALENRLPPRPAPAPTPAPAPAPAPVAAALVRQDPEERQTANVYDRITDPPHELGAAEVTVADAAAQSPLVGGVLGPTEGGSVHVGSDDSPAAAHVPVVVRMVGEPAPAEEAVAVVQGEFAGAAAPTAEEQDVPVVSVSLGPDGAEVAVDGRETDLQEAGQGRQGQGAVEATKQLLLLARMANVAEAQRELEQRARVTEALREAYDSLQGASDAATSEQDQQDRDIVQEPEISDGPTLYDLLANDNEGQTDQDQQELLLDQTADAELARQLLLYVVTHPEALVEQEPEAGTGTEAEEVADHRPAGGAPERVAQGVAEEPVQARRQLDQLSHGEQDVPEPESVVSWTQLNEDDKQDTLMPKLAARGLDGDDLPVTESKSTRSEGEKTPERMVPEVAEVAEVAEVPEVSEVAEVAEAVKADEDEGRQLQLYRDLLSRRVPLMHHVLQLRRSQQEALQQEQRATAYLQLLDLHLRQHQQEAAARQRRRQHLRDLQRLQAYALQLQQQDQRLYEQQVWWGQQEPQAYAQRAQADQQLYNQQTSPGPWGARLAPQQVSGAQKQCDCPHRVARGVHMSYEQPRAAC